MAQWLEVRRRVGEGMHVDRLGAHDLQRPGVDRSVVLDLRGRQEILGSADSPMVCGVLTISEGQAKRVDGGYLVNGSWGFASGLAARRMGARNLCADRRGRYSGGRLPGLHCRWTRSGSSDTWKVTQDARTGSNTIIAEDVFVPDAI